MTHPSSLCRAAAVLAGMVLLPGCAGLVGLKQVEPVDIAHAYDATQGAMEDLQFTFRERTKDALQARVVAVESDRTEVTVDLRAMGERETEFRVKVGVLGNEAQARVIMDKIKKRL